MAVQNRKTERNNGHRRIGIRPVMADIAYDKVHDVSGLIFVRVHGVN